MSLKYVHETCKQNADLLEGFFSFKKKKKSNPCDDLQAEA